MAIPTNSLRVFWWNFVGLVLCCAFTSCRTIQPPRVQSPIIDAKIPSLSIATYNIFVGNRDLASTAAIIRKLDADVVALQEVTEAAESTLNSALENQFPYRVFQGRLGLVSRFPIQRFHFVHSQKGMNGFLFAEIFFHGRPVQLVNLHLDPLRAWSFSDKLTLPFQLIRHRHLQNDELDQIFGNSVTKPDILLGDFNRTGDGAINRLKKLGYVDSFAAVNEQPESQPTLRYHLLGLTMGKRIDFIFHNFNYQTDTSTSSPGKPSDHDAVVSHLRILEN